MPTERAERPPADPECKRAHDGSRSSKALSAGSAASTPGSLVVGEQGEPCREPRRPPRADSLEERATLRRELQPDAPTVVARPNTAKQPCRFEPIDVTGERGGGDPFLARELAKRKPGAGADEPEERHLVRRDAQGLGLAAQVAREPQERRAQLLG